MSFCLLNTLFHTFNSKHKRIMVVELDYYGNVSVLCLKMTIIHYSCIGYIISPCYFIIIVILNSFSFCTNVGIEDKNHPIA